MCNFDLSGPCISKRCPATEKAVLEAVQCLLRKLDHAPKYKEAYRLDVIPDHRETCTIQVTVSPTVWFETVQRHQPEEVVKAAFDWIRKTRSEISDAEHGPLLDDKIYVSGRQEHSAACQIYFNEGLCVEHAGTAGSKRTCTSPVEDLSDPDATCKSYIFDGLRAEWLVDDPHYYLLQSPQARRELILLPKQGYEPQGQLHLTNEDLVDSLEAWGVILGLALRLKARIEVNFGVWEKLQHDNVALQSCHGHIHFYLTATHWKEMLEWSPHSSPHKVLAKKMKNIQFPAPDRRVQDCDELEQRVDKALTLLGKLVVSSKANVYSL